MAIMAGLIEYTACLVVSLLFCFFFVFRLILAGRRRAENVTRRGQKSQLLWREVVLLEDVEMKKRRGQAHSDVHGRHLVLLHGRGDVTEEAEQCLENLPVFIRHQHDGRLDGLQPLVLWHVYKKCTWCQVSFDQILESHIQKPRMLSQFKRNWDEFHVLHW